MSVPQSWLKMNWVLMWKPAVPLSTACPELCNKSPFSAFTKPLWHTGVSDRNWHVEFQVQTDLGSKTPVLGVLLGEWAAWLSLISLLPSARHWVCKPQCPQLLHRTSPVSFQLARKLKIIEKPSGGTFCIHKDNQDSEKSLTKNTGVRESNQAACLSHMAFIRPLHLLYSVSISTENNRPIKSWCRCLYA
jgi:hypothetical protein